MVEVAMEVLIERTQFCDSNNFGFANPLTDSDQKLSFRSGVWPRPNIFVVSDSYLAGFFSLNAKSTLVDKDAIFLPCMRQSCHIEWVP